MKKEISLTNWVKTLLNEKDTYDNSVSLIAQILIDTLSEYYSCHFESIFIKNEAQLERQLKERFELMKLEMYGIDISTLINYIKVFFIKRDIAGFETLSEHSILQLWEGFFRNEVLAEKWNLLADYHKNPSIYTKKFILNLQKHVFTLIHISFNFYEFYYDCPEKEQHQDMIVYKAHIKENDQV